VSPETEPEAQLRLFPLDPPKRTKGQRRIVPTYSDEQRAAFRRTEEVIAGIRPSWLPGNRKLCVGCGQGHLSRPAQLRPAFVYRSSIERGFATARPSSGERSRSTAGHS
jgi:hypothetical protein